MNEHVHPIIRQALNAMTRKPVEHVITKRNGPGCYIVMCSCGARRQFPRQNALARAAKVRAWIAAHGREIDAQDAAAARCYCEHTRAEHINDGCADGCGCHQFVAASEGDSAR